MRPIFFSGGRRPGPRARFLCVVVRGAGIPPGRFFFGRPEKSRSIARFICARGDFFVLRGAFRVLLDFTMKGYTYRYAQSPQALNDPAINNARAQPIVECFCLPFSSEVLTGAPSLADGAKHQELAGRDRINAWSESRPAPRHTLVARTPAHKQPDALNFPSIRREFLDHVLIWNAVDLERKLEEFRIYYNENRVQ
jgi:hypothetical protein